MDPLDLIISQLSKFDELETARTLLTTFKKYSSSIEQYDQLGRLFHDVKDWPSAIECAEHTLALAPSTQALCSARANLAKLNNHANNPASALRYLNANLLVNPDNYEYKMERLFSNYLLGNFDESRAEVEQIMNDPDAPIEVVNRCRFNYGSYQLDNNQFKEGLINFIDVGHNIGIWPKVKFPGPAWDGTVTPGQTIAILAEGGIGDEVINIRFMKNITDLGMNPIFITNRDDTMTMFNRIGFTTVRSINEVPGDAQWVLSMYLPIVLNLEADQVWTGPYLTPSSVYVEKWMKLLDKFPMNTGKRKKVALKWSGNPYYEQDLHRSLPLDKLTECVVNANPLVSFVSVQKEHTDSDEVDGFGLDFDAAPYLDTLEDLLACLSLMDHTVTSCTSVAHIAAAAGLPVTVCPPIATYYTWLGDTKWYGDNCTILRQYKWRDWSHLKEIKL